MAIKLLALDLDGTLLTSSGDISRANRQAIEEVRRRGVHVVLATGRRFRDARPVALELVLGDDPIIAHNGALTKHARTAATVAARLLPLEAARAVLRIGRACGADAMVSDDPHGAGLLVYERRSEGNKELARYIEWSRRVVGTESEVLAVASLVDYLDHDPVHIAFAGGCATMDDLGRMLAAELNGRVRIVRTFYTKKDFALLDIISPEASKGAGLAAVAAEYGVAREEVMAIGDNFNDLEMLEFAGTGVVMGNAEAELRRDERFHPTASNDEDGVALAIERFILNAR